MQLPLSTDIFVAEVISWGIKRKNGRRIVTFYFRFVLEAGIEPAQALLLTGF